jgi:hypothetical protein
MFLRRHDFVGKSNHCLQAPADFERLTIRLDSDGRSDSDANFQTCQFDRSQGRGNNPLACEGRNSAGNSRINGGLGSGGVNEPETSIPSTLTLDSIDIAAVFQAFGVNAVEKHESTGLQVGYLSGGHTETPRLITRENWWVFRSDTFQLFLRDLLKGRRDGKRIAKKATVALYQFFYFHASDADIFGRYRKLFKTVAAVKTFREGIFKKGCSRFGEIQDPFGPWKGRYNDPAWIQFREGQEQKRQQRLEENEPARAETDKEEPENVLVVRVAVSEQDEECVLSL